MHKYLINYENTTRKLDGALLNDEAFFNLLLVSKELHQFIRGKRVIACF
jgi:hypothetical protein